ncbi:hypothetical protein AVEN_187353-1 [Araneus ventricosus]|uniref:Helitron helicase-like domain-containing protein n=1 Tax=Araneus ventricosus TaxID=182803 RepID=A0A4Y2Q2T7_ARAVE|nr:hypothetical protein AVEN_187353-1 [Araneus ventricosus]
MKQLFLLIPQTLLFHQKKTHRIESVLTHDAPLPWPNISSEPINEFITVGYVVMAFPALFPTGAADLRSLHQASVSPLEYFQHLFKYKDCRFARNPRSVFLAMDNTNRWSSLQNGKICLQRNTDISNLTAAQLKDKFREDPGLMYRLMCFNSSIRARQLTGDLVAEIYSIWFNSWDQQRFSSH